MDELKCCPFCKGEAMFEVDGFRRINFTDRAVAVDFHIECSKCHTKLPTFSTQIIIYPNGEIDFAFDEREDAIKIWNGCWDNITDNSAIKERICY